MNRHLQSKLEKYFQRCADFVFARWPRAIYNRQQLARSKIVSHRGEHDNSQTLENTLDAFDKAASAGVWGIELDVRWTADDIPVVFHDPDLRRLFGKAKRINRMPWQTVKKHFPSIPLLADVVERYGKRLHLMVEIKRPPEKKQTLILLDVLSPLEPAGDFHLIGLNTDRLNPMARKIPERALVAVSYNLPLRFSSWVLHRQWGGICAHYLLMPRSIIRKHKQQGQHIGTGYAASRNSLLREINRGVDWIFSNKAAAMQQCLEAEKLSWKVDRGGF